MIAIPGRGEIGLLNSGGTVLYLDTRTLAPVTEAREFTGEHATMLCGSPGGLFHALGSAGPGGRGTA